MLKPEGGLNFEYSDATSDISLYTEFASRAALDAYQIHPDHGKVKDFLPLVRTERRVVDYEVWNSFQWCNGHICRTTIDLPG